MKCPNCNGEIGRFELSPNCKHCGVNIFYSQQKSLLARDAKKCELEYASFRILVAKLKYAFIKGPIPVLRIVAMVIAIGAIFIPFANVFAEFSLLECSLSFGALGIYTAFTDGTITALLSIAQYASSEVALCLALLSLVVVIFLLGFGIFMALVLSFLNIQKSARITRGICIAGFIVSVVAAAVSVYMPYAIGGVGFLQAQTGFGAFACAIVFVFIYVLNYFVKKKNIQPEIKEVDIKRVQLNKKVKAGELSLDSLSLPIFETEEEREKRIQRETESKALAQMAKGGEAVE